MFKDEISTVAHAYNLRYLGGEIQEDQGQPVQVVFEILNSKNNQRCAGQEVLLKACLLCKREDLSSKPSPIGKTKKHKITRYV
jgi:hypothetical protein